MKKFMLLILLPTLLISSSLLTSCNDKNDTGSQLIISEVVEGSSSNKAIELFNLSQKQINLDKYKLEVQYSENSSEVIKLEGIVNPNETFVIVNKSAKSELLEKADLRLDLLFNGSQPIILKKGNNICDIIGIKNYFSSDWYKDKTLSRKKEYLFGRKSFDEYDWIRYNIDNYSYLNTIEVSLSENELLEGPKLTQQDYEAPFSYLPENSSTRLGGGGLTMVMVSSYVDGDTTFFNFLEENAQEAGISIVHKVRYQNVDTPESYTGNIQEFGLVAKEFTKNQLKKAGLIYVQTVKDGMIFETFDRVLGWVWADGTLMNHKLVKAGYSEVEFGSIDNMLYKDVSYSSFLYDAMLYAKKNKLGLHGEIDPYWDYDNNCVKDGNQGSEK